MYEKAQWGVLERELTAERHARRPAFTHFADPIDHTGGPPMTEIDSAGWTDLGREFATEEARRRSADHDAGLLPTGTVLAMVAALRADLINRGANLDRVTTSLEQLVAAGWKLPADQWLHLAGDTWGEVMRAGVDQGEPTTSS